MRNVWAILFIGLLGPAVHAGGVTPAAELRAALDDLATRVAEHERSHTRYLSLYAIPREQWPMATAVVSFVINSVSQADTIAVPQPVEGSQGRLLRVSLRRYRIDAAAWDAIAAEEPYWHLRAQVLDPRGGQATTVVTDGGWVGLAEAAALRALTSSIGAVLRADHFVARAATTADDGHYYRLAGVPRQEADFFRLLGIDQREIGRLGADEGANLFHSGVTRKVRRIVRRQGPLGAAWHTYDVDRSTAERDPIRNPVAFQYDAGEHIAAKRNGLHLFALYDRQGRRQDAVPDKIAKDSSDLEGAGVIVPLLSCVRCHTEEGLRPFVNDQQRLLSHEVDLYVEDEAVAERLASFYGRDLDKRLRRDREDYADAVAKATGGLRVSQLAKSLAEHYRAYSDRPVTLRQAAAVLGLSEAECLKVLPASDDPVILALCAGLQVQRQQWEASFAQAATLASGGTQR